MLVNIQNNSIHLSLPEDEMESRICIFNMIRDIPYAVLPELNSYQTYTRILELNRGSCMPKHLLLCELFQRLGLDVLYAVYPFRWNEFNHLYPAGMRKLADQLPVSYHLACRVIIDERPVLVDATIDTPLAKVGLPVNIAWDGLSDTVLPIEPCGEEELYHPSEAVLMKTKTYSEEELAFFRMLNSWMDEARQLVK